MDKVLCCIFNYNENEKSIEWWKRLSPHFDTVILDSGSNPPCLHEGALNLPNIFYSGLMNKAYELLKEKGYRWLMIVTSDIEISDKHTARLVERMKFILTTSNVGLYQPSCAWSRRGRAHHQSMCHFTGRMRCVNFQEGWYHMVCREVLDEIMPVDTSINLLGWGIDVALSHIARVQRRLIVVDDKVRVLHPKGTGYNRDKAAKQMEEWLKTIPGFTSPRHYLPIKDKIR